MKRRRRSTLGLLSQVPQTSVGEVLARPSRRVLRWRCVARWRIRVRPEGNTVEAQPHRALIEPVHLPAALRNEIVELLAQALIEDYKTFPTSVPPSMPLK